MKSNTRLYKFPIFTPDNAKRVENFVYNLEQGYKNRELDSVEVTWLDQANNWLMEIGYYSK